MQFIERIKGKLFSKWFVEWATHETNIDALQAAQSLLSSRLESLGEGEEEKPQRIHGFRQWSTKIEDKTLDDKTDITA